MRFDLMIVKKKRAESSAVVSPFGLSPEASELHELCHEFMINSFVSHQSVPPGPYYLELESISTRACSF